MTDSSTRTTEPVGNVTLTLTPDQLSAMIQEAVTAASAAAATQLADRIKQDQAHQARVPGDPVKLGEYVDDRLKHLAETSRSTRRVYASYLQLLADGTELTIDGKPLEGFRDHWLHDITRADLQLVLKYVAARAQNRLQERAEARKEAGREVRRSAGEGANDNAIGAFRYLFSQAIIDKHLGKEFNPAESFKRRPKNYDARIGLIKQEISEALDVIGSTGDDPELDLILSETYVITSARAFELADLTIKDLCKPEAAIWLLGKNGKKVWQPVPPSLITRLLAFAAERGSTEPDDLVFLKRRKDGTTAPITRRRLDNIFCDRLQAMIQWADRVQVTCHVFRHTGVTLIERHEVGGKAVAQAYARHTPKGVTDIYSKASRQEVAAAVCRVFGPGEVHPWESREPRLPR